MEKAGHNEGLVMSINACARFSPCALKPNIRRLTAIFLVAVFARFWGVAISASVEMQYISGDENNTNVATVDDGKDRYVIQPP